MEVRIENLIQDKKRIALFDGECILCHNTVIFVIKHDPKSQISFVPLQSDIGNRLLEYFDLPNDLSTMVFIEDEKAHTRSTAVLRMLSYLTFPWNYFQYFTIIPACIRDFFYNLVGGSRYSLFGKYDVCIRPTENIKSRFIEYKV